MRIAKYLAQAGVASRRAAEQIVRDGRVTVNGHQLEDPARDVDQSDSIMLDGLSLKPEPGLVVYALHKPEGVVSTASDPQRRPTVVSLISSPLRLFPVGRLDLDTAGLILLTNDGELAHRLTHPRYGVGKTYRALVGGRPVSDRAVRALRRGVTLEDGPTAPAEVRRLGPHSLQITVHEGRKRQVRRMCEQVGHPVRQLTRTAFGPLGLDELPPGHHRRLTAEEVRELRRAAEGRSPSTPGSS